MYDGVSDVVFCIKDREGRYVVANEAFLRRANLSEPSELIGRRARDVFPVLLAAGYERQDERVWKTGREIRDQLEMVTNRDGTSGWYLARKVPVRDGRGEVVAVAGVSRDLRAAEADPKISRLAATLEEMREHFASDLRISQLAENMGMSLSGFLRLTQSVLGVSPRKLLTRLRVEEAARLLGESDFPLSRIALDCGFCDQATFCRQFKAVTGNTPSEHRRQFG